MITRTEIEIEIEIGMTIRDHSTTTGIEIEVGLTLDMEEVKEENTKDLKQVKDTLTGMNSVTTVTEQVIQHIGASNWLTI